jgi:hypothetical protein
MEWGEAIIDAIEECRMMVLVFTANANASPQIRREVERAVNRGVAILPVRIEDVLPGKGLEYFIGNVHWLDALNPPLEAHLKSLAGTIKIVLARTVPGAPPKPVEGEKQLPASGQRSGEGAPGSGRGRESAPRRFWSTRTWTWAAGTVSVLLLGAVFIGVHFTSHSVATNPPAGAPAPVGAPNPVFTPSPAGGPVGPEASPLPAPATIPAVPKTAKPAAKAPEAAAGNGTLPATMRDIQDELSSIGTVNFTIFGKDTANGSPYQNATINQISDVVADAAQCRVSYHWKVWRNGTSVTDKNSWFLLHDVTRVLVEPLNQYASHANVAAGHPNLVATSTAPPLTALVVQMPSWFNEFPFTNKASADRAAEAVTQAVRLCGGHLAN